MAKNKRCPLQEECERKCSYQGHELDCDYYHVNARKDYYIEDQEEIRRKIEKKEEEEYWEKWLAEKDEDEEDCSPEEYKNEPLPEVTCPDTPTESDVPQGTKPSLHLHGSFGVTEKIKQAMYEAAKQFVYIGFLLWEVQTYGYYKEAG